MAALFLLYVVAEVAAVWAVSSAVGILGMLGLLIVGALFGSWLARREGARAARAFMTAARAGRSPQTEVTDGMLVGLGGLLILVPGFLSDIAGLLLLLPPSRAVVRKAWLRRVEKRMPSADRVIVVDSEVVQDDRAHPVIEGR
ncbi:FxsA family protein [Amycolatopsis pithecellobii]|uniref:FxsA family protein n=1 Tax=Amycolatopsis pithecellobii TaxID=664692 RepID=A0A6N7ZBV0_9PSEU|nr:FxsA family protein [Amycolatopsis pithecellobii]MTD59175.1 FxsA family protein [Amycolatopsis pithecellobii]